MKSWISAKNVFHTAMSGDTKFPMCVMKSPRTKGCPLALARMLSSTNPRPNMKGWNCSAASRIQNRPRTTWSTRCERTASGKRLGAASSSSWCVPASLSMPCFTLPAPPGIAVSGPPASAAPPAQASLTAATSFCRVSLASPKSIVVLGS